MLMEFSSICLNSIPNVPRHQNNSTFVRNSTYTSHMSLFIELDGKLFFDLLQKALSRAFARRGLAGHSTKLCKRMKDGKRPLRQFKTRSLFSISPFSSRQSRLASFAKEWKMQRRNNDKESSVPFSWVSSKLAGKISDRN